MEDPPEMIPDDPRGQVLLSGSHDWVSLAEAQHIVRAADRSLDAPEVRRRTLQLITDLLVAGLVEAGEIGATFAPWAGDADVVVRRIADDWPDEDEDLGVGRVCWLANTPRGDAVADHLAQDGRITRRS